ncbi:DUF4397 domain-containing protein [Pseudoflavonifractor sp. BIOML-A6]|nr:MULTISPECIES: DUF4397 domain-containing protein [unclassified Pseudoflavonifractor]MTQ98223.1 DUF4397 domain-containing protein [Pseudoflavonifractor sp. BIOML-A16]MTR06842.1 DUF4397 domain-containing protein [Pseudoflavonifractor sp. BIOML-A15]MTR31828.1 DUF4397 domain-containing protein [Pseudoflavonifractor sp. BIOML-A14]MTR73583.1 DUF4397 domain-containing protein [Pseudoflavonifractor sp. BIOML-A18]MTS64866.1 DUF4397 domain-containing protein [Pseudoflavonifractor sp. BIOML-A5]MTS7247
MENYEMPSMRGMFSRAADQPATPPPEDYPVVPLPPVVPDDQPPAPDYPVPPIAGEENPPVEGPVFPVPPIAGGENPPVEGPVFPVPPIAGPGNPPVAPGPVYPVSGYCTVRFLNAVTDFDPMRVLIGGRVVADNLGYGDVGSYYRVRDGFRTVTITSAQNPRIVLYRQSVPFAVNEIITLAIVRGTNGLELVRVSDIPCQNRPRNRACIRAVNLVYNSPALDVILNDGRVVFSDVRYREVTAFKQARPGDYGFYVAQTPYMLSPVYSDIQTLEELPIILANYFLPGFGDVQPLTSSYVDARANSMNTIYIMGAWSRDPVIRTKVVQDF